MKNKLKKYSALVITMVMLAMVAIMPNVNAAEPTVGSITIICREQPNGEETNTPIKGVRYEVYKVADNATLEEAKLSIGTNQIDIRSTDANGRVQFSNLPLGRYLVHVDNPDEVNYADSKKASLVNYEDFIVDIPMTNAEGTAFVYDVTVEPKVETVYGNAKITKTDMEGNPLKGVQFKIAPYGIQIDKVSKQIIGMSAYAMDSQVLTTDDNGNILLNNIAYCRLETESEYEYIGYRLTEISNPNDEYIISNQITKGMNIFLYVDENGIVKTNYTEGNTAFNATSGGSSLLVSVNEASDLTTITVMNEKPTITKKVKNNSGEFVDKAGVFSKNRITFKITADVPSLITGIKTYKISDNLPTGLTLDRSSIKVEGVVGDGFEIVPSTIYTLSDTGLEIAFNTSKMGKTVGEVQDLPKYNSIVITYDVTLNTEIAVIGGEGNINTASLTYTNNMGNVNEASTKTISDTAEVHTGAINIEKIDRADASVKLAGAKFKVATSEANAKAGIFVTDENDADIEVTTDAQGEAMIKGLAYADNGNDVSYWLVETQAPKYKEVVDGVETEKSYNLLKSPVEVKVGKTTHNTAVQVKNGKGINLPLTGGIGIVIFALAGIGIMTASIVLNKKKEVIE